MTWGRGRSGSRQVLIVALVASSIVACSPATLPREGAVGADAPTAAPTASREHWRQTVQRVHGRDLEVPPRYPENRLWVQGNGFRKTDAAARRVLDRLLSRNGLPRTTATVGIYACDQVNAEALVLARRIRICRGLLPHVPDEDTLAFAIGHELAHILLKHDDLSARDYVKKTDPVSSALIGVGTLGVLGATLATGGWAGVAIYYAGGLAAMTADDARSTTLGASFSRESELEADRVGLMLAMEAGYNPSAAVAFIDQLAAAADARERAGPQVGTPPVNDALGTVLWLRGASKAAMVQGKNLRTHPDGEARVTQMAQLASSTPADVGARAATPLSFADELDEQARASRAGQWRDDPNFALEYAWREFAVLTKETPPDEVIRGNRRAIHALESVPPPRRSEAVNRNRAIFLNAVGDRAGSRRAAVDWWNSGGELHPKVAEILILLGHEDLARRAVQIECRNKQPTQICVDFDGRKNSLVLAQRRGENLTGRLVASLARGT